MLWASLLRTYPSAVFTSLAITVAPGFRPEMVMLPASPVTYSPSPTGLPEASVTWKVTPAMGFVVPFWYL